MKKLIFFLLPLFVLFGQVRSGEKDPREIIEKLRIYKLTEILDLTEEQTTKLFPRLKEMRKTEQEFHRQRTELIKQMKDLITNNAREQELLKILNRYQELQKKRMITQTEEIENLRKILTPVQQAKFLIFQEDFEREIRELIREVKGHRPPPQPEE